MTTLVDEQYLTTYELARKLRKDVSWARRNPLGFPRIKIGSEWLYPKSRVEEKLQELAKGGTLDHY